MSGAQLPRLFVFLIMLTLQSLAWAHKPSDSYLTLRAEAASPVVKVRWDIALRDLDYVLALDRDGNGELTWGEVKQRSAEITALATGQLKLSAQDQACSLTSTGPLMLETHSDGTYAVLSLDAACASAASLADGLKASYALFFDVDPTHRGLVQWSAPGAESPQALIFSVDSAEQTLSGTPATAWETLRQYVIEGVWHIWIGFDHILFLLALLLPSVLVRRNGQWTGAPGLGGAVKEVLKVVTAFTIAHSITLSLAALEVVTLPSRLVESVIAASVVLAALSNLRGTIENRRWVMAFIFGLIHGFGFASVLADLGLPQDALVIALIGFNVGVELGQLAIVAVFLPLAYTLRETRFYQVGVLKGGSVLVAILAGWWLIERMFDL
jgi:HupE / UreJ protein